MKSFLIVIGALLILGGVTKGVIYYTAFERLPEATYQVWASAENRMQGLTSRVASPFASAIGELGISVPAPPPERQMGPSPATRAQFEAIVHDLALLCLLQYLLLGVAAGSVLFGLAHVIGLLEARRMDPVVMQPAQPVVRKY